MPQTFPIWKPTSKSQNITEFQNHLAQIYGLTFNSYSEFHKWSVSHLEKFWSAWAKSSKFIFRREGTETVRFGKNFWETEWFPGSEINFAENLLEKGEPNHIALHFLREDGQKIELTYRDLKTKVTNLANYFVSIGINKGDRICGLVPNSPISTIGMLAATSLGAIWSSASPDFGVKGVLDRFEQISPKVLLTVDSYLFKGKKISILEKVIEVSNRLGDSNPEYKATLISSFLGDSFSLDSIRYPIRYEEILESKSPLIYTPITFQDPVYIMFSSGTTGLPKCIVQGAGVLLNQTKELALHCNLTKNDKLFYYTTCGWMMWNWSQATLALGATLYQFDGNPFYPNWQTLWDWSNKENINIFGTSAKYLSVLESEKAEPINHFNLESLKIILSTGSPLFPSGFRYVYSNIKKDVQLSSISGGTDLNGCFALGYPELPVFEGELQCIGLGMDVKVFSEDGLAIEQEKGELVCLKPFPSMPLYFWNDPDRKKYKSAYFDRFENIWCHGDFAEITTNGGMVIHGRSDATLNPGGVRIGTADIYSVVETFAEIADSVIIGQEWKDDVRVILFLKMAPNHMLDDELKSKVKDKIKNQTSPRHVPSLVLEVKDIPYTVNGKKVEIAVKQTVLGQVVKNQNALANPEALVYFANRKELL